MKDHLQERIDKLTYKGIFINKLDRDKDSLHENSDLTNAASMDDPLPLAHSTPAVSLTTPWLSIYINTN